uniref:Proline dehydrogenase n=1 Tax=Myotis myotis TaxID=51298 RepID=A0A7J7S374_MYOMY|nr:proline dehydrogenase 1 [Myotis myotis]
MCQGLVPSSADRGPVPAEGPGLTCAPSGCLPAWQLGGALDVPMDVEAPAPNEGCRRGLPGLPWAQLLKAQTAWRHLQAQEGLSGQEAGGPALQPRRGRTEAPVRGRSSTRPTRPSETAGTASSAPAPTSTPTKPSVTATWRRSCAASRLQLQFSDVLTKWRRFFHQMAAEQGKVGLNAMDTKLEVAALQESVARMGIASRKEIEDWFRAETLGVSGTLDLLDWSGLIDSRTELSKHLVVPNMQTGQLEPLLSGFTEEEERQMRRMLQRMDVLAKKATEAGVRLMVDAEQTYFQPAISRLTLEMQRRFNVEKPLIFNTYQCYLRDAYDNVTLDLELARREGWCFGAKLVRGAYMAQERARAAEIGYEDPINPTYEATNAMYHRCLNYVLEELKNNGKAEVMVASHNEDTVRFTLRRMEELGLHPADRQVYFGQLLGMCDQISFPLGQAGFPVYKYVPYGPVMEVLPYLSRRALENNSVMKGARRERQLLWQELKRRLYTGNLFYRPA